MPVRSLVLLFAMLSACGEADSSDEVASQSDLRQLFGAAQASLTATYTGIVSDSPMHPGCPHLDETYSITLTLLDAEMSNCLDDEEAAAPCDRASRWSTTNIDAELSIGHTLVPILGVEAHLTSLAEGEQE